MLAALAAGDQVNWDNARSAFDQLYISTARGVYLDKRAGEQGYRRPGDVGMSDELFRQLAIVSKTSKLTQDALLQVLEVYYGRDTVRARAVSVGASPFVLADEDDLQLLLDGREEITVTFHQEDFSKIWLATGLEAAIVITRALRKAGSHAFAVSDGDHITIYSGRLGLGSSIEVLGGTAQVQFLFPSTKQTLYDQPRRVLVAQTSDEVDIVIPATTQAVGRSPRSASYGVTSPSLAITSLVREVDGIVTVTTGTNHGFHLGQTVLLYGVFPTTVGLPVPLTFVHVPEVNTYDTGDAIIDTWPATLTFTDPLVSVTLSFDAHVDNFTEYNTVHVEFDGISQGFITVAAPHAHYSRTFGGISNPGTSTVTVTPSTSHGDVDGSFTTMLISNVRVVITSDPPPRLWEGGLNGFVIITSIPDETSFTYETPGYGYTISGSTTARVVALTASPGLWLGPYVFDPKQGLALTSTEALVDIGLEANRQYAVLTLTVSGGDLTPANRFPDTEGFLVFNFGWDEVVGPVRYYGRLSGSTLKLDYDFVFKDQVLAGTKVHLLSQRAPYQPTRLLNGFYATASGTGRQAASIAIDETVAAGTKVKLTVVYPGDRGLGAEGFPDHGDKLSDKVYVWAGSESEVASAKLPAKAI